MDVVVGDLNADATQAVADEIAAAGGSAKAWVLDVAEPQDLTKVVGERGKPVVPSGSTAIFYHSPEQKAIYDAHWEAGGLSFYTAFKDLLLDQAANETLAPAQAGNLITEADIFASGGYHSDTDQLRLEPAVHLDLRHRFLLRAARPGQRRLDHRLRRTDEGHHGAIRGLAGIDVKEAHAVDGLHLVGDLFDDRRIAAFAEVGNTLDELAHDEKWRRDGCQSPALRATENRRRRRAGCERDLNRTHVSGWGKGRAAARRRAAPPRRSP